MPLAVNIVASLPPRFVPPSKSILTKAFATACRRCALLVGQERPRRVVAATDAQHPWYYPDNSSPLQVRCIVVGLAAWGVLWRKSADMWRRLRM